MDCVAEQGVAKWLEAKTSGLCNCRRHPLRRRHPISFKLWDLATSGITYDQYTVLCPNCELHACEAKRTGCESFVKQLPAVLGEFLALTEFQGRWS